VSLTAGMAAGYGTDQIADAAGVSTEARQIVQLGADIASLITLRRSLGTNPPHSTLSQPGGLSATEGIRMRNPNGKLTKPTHPLEKHGPHITDRYLIERVQKELIDKGLTKGQRSRSRFDNRATMEAAIARTKEAKSSQISAWLSKKTGVGQVFSVKHSPGMGNLGTAYEVDPNLLVPRRVQDSLEDIQVQLISNGNGGYLIHSANPQ
jgi:hypothetical protein